MRKLLSALALAALLAAGCSNGDNSSASSDAMVIKITMLDNKYEPSEVTNPATEMASPAKPSSATSSPRWTMPRR